MDGTGGRVHACTAEITVRGLLRWFAAMGMPACVGE